MSVHSEWEDCPVCKTGFYAFKNLKGQNMTVGNTTLQAAVAGLKATLAQKLSAKTQFENSLKSVQVEIDEINAGIAAIEKLIEPKSPVRIAIYHIASRSGRFSRPGHYIEAFIDGTYKCSCEGFTFNGYCWAVDKVKATPAYSRSQFRYINGEKNFDVAKAKVTFKK